MKISEIIPLFEQLKTKKVYVIGDFIIDHNRIVRAKRLSPEAPIPVVEPEIDEFRIGGAGNVAQNLKALGVGKVELVTVIGPSNYKQSLFDEPSKKLLGSSMLVFEAGRLTTIKERVLSRRPNQQIVRIDTQSNKPIKPKSAKLLINMIEASAIPDAIVFSDYAHGVCVPLVIKAAMSFATKNSIPTVVDSKAKDTLDKYIGATVAIPNLDEAKAILGIDETDEKKVAIQLREVLKLQAAAVTLGAKGVMLATIEGTKHYHVLNTNPQQEVVDVTGAGDTVAAIVAIGLILKLSYDDIFRLANVAAGVKVQKRGVATVSIQEIASAGLLYD